jgi:hypothetical protein
MGLDYASVSVEKKQDGLYISQTFCQNADKGSEERQTAGVKVEAKAFWLRVRVEANAVCSFSFSVDGKSFVPLGQPFHARQGRWIGAKVGIFAVGKGVVQEMGYADYDWFRVE